MKKTTLTVGVAIATFSLAFLASSPAHASAAPWQASWIGVSRSSSDAEPPEIVVTKALYGVSGDPTKQVDLTASIRQKIADGNFTLRAETAPATDSLPPLVDGKIPTNVDELWGNYDPTKEPLETEVVREWREGDITIRHVVFTVGTFKGQKSRLAAFYAFPKSDKKLPGILQIHGGGGKARVSDAIWAADNGYAGLSINWLGNPMDKMQPGDANTDWGAIDPTQKHNSHYDSTASTKPSKAPTSLFG